MIKSTRLVDRTCTVATALNVPPDSGGVGFDYINDKGAIVGDYFASGTYHGFLRSSQGTYTTIDPSGSMETFLFGIDNKGVIMGSFTSDMQHGFVRAADGTYTTFDPKNSVNTSPEAINKKGAITGFWERENSASIHGFLRTP